MSDKVLKDIIKYCLELDIKASEIYSELSKSSNIKDLKHFWQSMSEEEREHVGFWKELLKLAEQNILPQVFDEPENIKAELENTYEKVKDLHFSSRNESDISKSFLTAYRMEFYLLHPAFETLFHFIKLLEDKKNPEDEYENHISKFIDALNKHGSVTIEMELLGETLRRLWHENKALALQSAFDELTGLLNRRGFFNIIKSLGYLSKRNNFNVSFMMVDIDHFKKVNDTHGHKKGDKVLHDVSAILRENIRISDFAGRYGGEEFLLFLFSIEPESISTLAEKIRRNVEEITKSDVPVTVSIGVSYGLFQDNVEEDVMKFINKADTCLYEAKNTGRNKIVISKL